MNFYSRSKHSGLMCDVSPCYTRDIERNFAPDVRKVRLFSPAPRKLQPRSTRAGRKTRSLPQLFAVAVFQGLSSAVGSPTRMKNRAKAWERCSR